MSDPATTELIQFIGPDAYIEAHAEAYDAIVPGLGDLLRDLYRATVRVIWDHLLCDGDATAEYHRWNCFGTPIWAQTMRDLDINPWTVLR